jgi:hypothetical protein
MYEYANMKPIILYNQHALIKIKINVKGIENLSNEVIAENFPNLGKDTYIHVQEANGTPNKRY